MEMMRLHRSLWNILLVMEWNMLEETLKELFFINFFYLLLYEYLEKSIVVYLVMTNDEINVFFRV